MLQRPAYCRVSTSYIFKQFTIAAITLAIIKYE
jgi:hypothetical protein